MMTMSNSRERTAAEFEGLFKAADHRFHLGKIHHTPGSSLSILEVRFNTECSGKLMSKESHDRAWNTATPLHAGNAV